MPYISLAGRPFSAVTMIVLCVAFVPLFIPSAGGKRAGNSHAPPRRMAGATADKKRPVANHINTALAKKRYAAAARNRWYHASAASGGDTAITPNSLARR